MIRLSGAGVRFGRRWVLRGLDLELAAGTCLAVLGPNGRGKTTLIKAAIGALRLNEGQRTAPALVGYVPQAVGPTVPYRTLDMVAMGRARSLGLFGAPGAADYRVAREGLARVGITHLAEQRYDRLSGGERQLTLLARALATGADTIVLDEPASALDLANQDRFLAILAELRGERRFALLFSSHLPQHAVEVADETLLLFEDFNTVRGPTAAVLTEANLERLYGIPVRHVAAGGAKGAFVPVFGRSLGSAPA